EAAGREPNEHEGNKDTAVVVAHGSVSLSDEVCQRPEWTSAWQWRTIRMLWGYPAPFTLKQYKLVS
ncbi:MAG: hypothetical protein WCJ35_25900, partial [Planctomycetota bacterium]